MMGANDSNITELPSEPMYCGKGFEDFQDAYKEIHGYASLLVCIFGSVANTLNIAVLTRREMTSPTNAILTGLAVADLLVMLEYIPYACHMYLPSGTRRPRQERYSYGWTFFVLFHANFAQVFHTISIWLTVTLAVWRYVAVAHVQSNRDLLRMNTTLVAIAGAYIICPVLCIPIYLAFSIEAVPTPLDFPDSSGDNNVTATTQNVTLYYVKISQLGKENNDFLSKVNFWIYSVVMKIIPCIALTFLSFRLISALMEAKRRRRNLTSNVTIAATSPSREEGKLLKRKPTRVEKERQTDRTTRMLLAVLLLFLITEFPQGILGLLSVALGEPFFNNCYLRLGEVMDILALINSGINFILYCAMSRQFRTTFSLLFKPKILNRCLPASQDNCLNDHNGATMNNMTQVTQV